MRDVYELSANVGARARDVRFGSEVRCSRIRCEGYSDSLDFHVYRISSFDIDSLIADFALKWWFVRIKVWALENDGQWSLEDDWKVRILHFYSASNNLKLILPTGT